MIYAPAQQTNHASVSFAQMVQEECRAGLDANERALMQAAAAGVDRYTDLLSEAGPLVMMRNTMRSALFCALQDVGAHELAFRILGQYVELPEQAWLRLKGPSLTPQELKNVSRLLFSGVLRAKTSYTAYAGVIWVLDFSQVSHLLDLDLLDLCLLPQLKQLLEHLACVFDEDRGRGSIGLAGFQKDRYVSGKHTHDMQRAVILHAGYVMSWCGQRREWVHAPELFSIS